MISSSVTSRNVEILIAEDSATQRERLKYLLEEQGYRVTSAANGKQAIELARLRQPTLVITDVVMPEMDGYGLCKALKSDPSLKDVPVMLVTSLSDSRDVVLGLECGADNFIRKPYQPDYLLQRINYLLMNLDLRRGQKMQVGIEINLGGQKYFITSERQQMLDLLISIYEQAAHINKELAATNQELSAANKDLESFSYSVSHDLRAPLRAIDGYSAMLAESYAEKLDDDGKRMLSVVRESCRNMSALIQDLLAFSRLGRNPVVKAPLDVDGLVREVLREARVESDYPKAEIAIGTLPPCQGDRALLKQVWTNFISNALKYSGSKPAPRVEISGNISAEEIEYRIKDNGAGFDMRHYSKLFGVFQRLHTQQEFPGTGVGLAIVHRIVTRHGGRVWARGQLGEGAEFCFSVPK